MVVDGTVWFFFEAPFRGRREPWSISFWYSGGNVYVAAHDVELGEMVWVAVEEARNGPLEAVADRLLEVASRYLNGAESFTVEVEVECGEVSYRVAEQVASGKRVGVMDATGDVDGVGRLTIHLERPGEWDRVFSIGECFARCCYLFTRERTPEEGLLKVGAFLEDVVRPWGGRVEVSWQKSKLTNPGIPVDHTVERELVIRPKLEGSIDVPFN
ncbi:hypothetical protein [Candidatus Caldatribacterium sp.]|uniref:hypothetical protein n=1 Tax=Candidatus Caldatribacterium sp. TaxID=2282143 RepID=UPI003845A8AA|nr:hypothetical protein [Candidatus Caldatribacterium sp.]